MRQLSRLLLVVLILAGSLAMAAPARAQQAHAVPGPCQTGTLPGGALWMICIPTSGWNGDLVMWGHGYVAFNQPLGFYNLSFDGIYLPTLVQNLGYAFATTSYRKNGLAILEGIQDVRQLDAQFISMVGHSPGHTYMTGASEGGAITTLLAERYPTMLSGALAACGPIGSFQRQIDYWGDFRVLFNYFFPGVVPGDPTGVPSYVIDNWDNIYSPRMTAAVQAHPVQGWQLISTSNAPIDLAHPSASVVSTTSDLMWYAVFATNDGIQELHGEPYGNLQRVYSGSLDDQRLNRLVQRVKEDPAAALSETQYETSGNITIPLVTIHTTGDDVIPFWNELLYKAKAHPSGKGSLTQIPVVAYGHCNFTAAEVLGAFALMVLQVTGHAPDGLVPTPAVAITR